MNPFTITLAANPGFSQRLLVILSAISILAIGVVAIFPINIVIKFLIVIAIVVWLQMAIREHCLHQGDAITHAQLRSDNSWEITLGQQEPVIAELLQGCLVQPWLTVLQFKLPDKRRKSLVLLPDNISADMFRRLRVRLRCG